MEKIVWDESYSVNVKVLDEQHQKLIEIVNKLIEDSEATVSSEIISDTLTEMTKYTHYHFSDEEQYMIKYGYPEYESHKKEHNNFKRKAAEFCLDTMRHKTTIPIEMLVYLRDWWLNHISKSDMKYGAFFKKKDIK
jgi:hemerythrin